MGAVALSRYLLLTRQVRLSPAETECDLARVDTLHRAGDQVAFAVDEFIVERVAFRFADFLEYDLLGCLGGDATEAARGMFDLHHYDIVELRFWVIEAGAFQSYFGGVAIYLVDNFFFNEYFGASGIGVNFGFNRLGGAGAGIFTIGGDQGALQGIQYDIGWQGACLRDFVEGDLQFVRHFACLQQSSCKILLDVRQPDIKRKVGASHFFRTLASVMSLARGTGWVKAYCLA